MAFYLNGFNSLFLQPFDEDELQEALKKCREGITPTCFVTGAIAESPSLNLEAYIENCARDGLVRQFKILAMVGT